MRVCSGCKVLHTACPSEINRRQELNEQYLENARGKVKDVRLFINGVSKRASELARGAKPLVPTLPQDDRSSLDIALLEIADGKIVISDDGLPVEG